MTTENSLEFVERMRPTHELSRAEGVGLNELLCRIGDDMTIEKRIVEAPYMTSALRREAAEEITRLRNALAQSVKIGAEHREGRLKALEWMAALESRLREIGDLAASCRTGPALREAMAQIETMTDMRHNRHCRSQA